jgi:hypothetical protein
MFQGFVVFRRFSMSLWSKLFGKKPEAAPPAAGTKVLSVREQLEARRVTLAKAVRAAPVQRVARPTSGPLYRPVYSAIYGHRAPAEMTQAEAVCYLVGAAEAYYQGDGLDGGLLGNYGDAETADTLPALRLIGAGAVADILEELLTRIEDLRDIDGPEYFKEIDKVDTALKAAGIDGLTDLLDAYLDRAYPWA